MSEEGILKQPENCEGIMKDYKKSKHVVKANKKKQSKRMNFIGIFFLLLLMVATGCSKKTGDALTELKPEQTDHKSGKEKQTAKDDKQEKTTEQEKKVAGSKAKLQDGEDLAKIFVYVCGAVNAPGVYGLSQDSRVYQAIDMAGGLSPDAAGEALNQASLVKDGERVYVPSQSDLEKGIGVGALPENAEAQVQGSKDDKMNINTCTKEELMTLPGIGSAKADSIISHRETSGPFSTTEELMQVEGIKEGVYNKIKDRITS